MKILSVLLAIVVSFSALSVKAEIAELNPFDPNVEQVLKKYDAVYEKESGLSPFIGEEEDLDIVSQLFASKCYRQTCKVWALISKSEQMLYLYIDGNLVSSWKVSTGLPGYETPNFDRHPNGRIYNKYTSTKYPEGDYMGLGNMPYAVFIQGGFALHGTPKGNWKRLGRKASHGCIRMHPDNGQYFNQLVRTYGIKRVWITVQ